MKSDEISHLTKKYVDLYKNRLEKLANDKKSDHITNAIKKEKYGVNYSFKPSVSLKNQKLA